MKISRRLDHVAAAFLILFPAAACDGGQAPPVPTRLTLFAGDGQIGTVGSTLPQVLQVQVTDREGNTISGTPVTWSVVPGSGRVSPATAQTGTGGTATTSWALGTTAGQQQARASVGGANPVTFAATATPSPAFTLTLAKTALGFDAVGPTDSLGPMVVKDAHDNVSSGATVTYSSEDEAVATVDASGTVISVAHGATMIMSVYVDDVYLSR